jgi:TrmH family RNA methyltransferase
MDGTNIYKTTLPQEGIMVAMKDGISKNWKTDKKQFYTSFGGPKTESLNVATATAIIEWIWGSVE